MRLSSKTKAVNYLQMYASNIITNDEYLQHLQSFASLTTPPAYLGKLTDWGLDAYQGLLNCHDDWSKVEHVIQKHYRGWRLRWRLRKMTVSEYFVILAWMRSGIEQINDMFKAIPRPRTSPAVAAIMREATDFGIYGIIDTLSTRQMCSDDEAGKIPIIVAIAKLRIDADKAIARQKIEDYNLTKIKSRR